MSIMSSRPRIVVFAYSEVGYVCLKSLLDDGADVVLVYTHEDDPGEEIWFHSVRDLARERGVPVRTPKVLGEAETEEIRAAAPELIFSFYYRAMIPAAVLEIPRLGAYNIHGALLPRYRGRACVNWAVLNGETETGATLHVMTQYADRGDIIARKAVPILFKDTALDVFLKVTGAARSILMSSLKDLEAGTAQRTPQDESLATKFGRRRPEDGRIDWNKTAVEIYNLVRAVTHPFPGAFTERNGKKLYIWKALPEAGTGKPGMPVSENPMLFGTGAGLLRILNWQYEGEEEHSAPES